MLNSAENFSDTFEYCDELLNYVFMGKPLNLHISYVRINNTVLFSKEAVFQIHFLWLHYLPPSANVFYVVAHVSLWIQHGCIGSSLWPDLWEAWNMDPLGSFGSLGKERKLSPRKSDWLPEVEGFWAHTWKMNEIWNKRLQESQARWACPLTTLEVGGASSFCWEREQAWWLPCPPTACVGNAVLQSRTCGLQASWNFL